MPSQTFDSYGTAQMQHSRNVGRALRPDRGLDPDPRVALHPTLGWVLGRVQHCRARREARSPAPPFFCLSLWPACPTVRRERVLIRSESASLFCCSSWSSLVRGGRPWAVVARGRLGSGCCTPFLNSLASTVTWCHVPRITRLAAISGFGFRISRYHSSLRRFRRLHRFRRPGNPEPGQSAP
jgi:hypothetical protein